MVIFTLLLIDKKATQVAYLTKYGLGMKRSLDQFIEFTGMDTRTQTAFGDRCRQLEWVPFTPDSNAEVDSTDVWGFNPEIIKANGPNIPLLTGSIEYKAFNAAQSAGLSSGSSLHGIQNLSKNLF